MCNLFSLGSLAPEDDDDIYEHNLVKRQDDEYSDRRRLKTKFVNGVEVVVRGKNFL